MSFFKYYLFTAVIAALITTPAIAMNIWPTNPYLITKPSGQSAAGSTNSALLFLDNGVKDNTRYQVRVFRWTQKNNQDVYQQQDEVQPQPPIIDFSNDKKQVVRLLNYNQSNPVSPETAYRLIVDQIPDAADPKRGKGGIQFRIRLVIPFFVYDSQVNQDYIPGVSGVPKKTPATSWNIIHRKADSYLEIKNNGPVHLRLADAFFSRKGSTQPVYKLSSGLSGYVLPGQSMQFPLKNWSLGSGQQLSLYSYYGDNERRLLSNE